MEARLSEIARFLALRPPFDALAPEELGEVVADTELEFYAADAVILSGGRRAGDFPARA